MRLLPINYTVRRVDLPEDVNYESVELNLTLYERKEKYSLGRPHEGSEQKIYTYIKKKNRSLDFEINFFFRRPTVFSDPHFEFGNSIATHRLKEQPPK